MNKVLYITAFPPSEKSAAEKNTKRMLEEFGQDFIVDLVYFKDAEVEKYTPDVDTIHILRIIPNSKLYRIKNALFYLYWHPLFTVRYNSAVLRWLQTQIGSNNYDAIIFDHSQTFLYAKRLNFKGPKLLLSHDIEAQRVKRSSNSLVYWQCRYTEKYVLSTPGAHLFALSQKDVNLINEFYGLKAEVINIYVDKRISAYELTRTSSDFVLFGNWDRPDNYKGALWLLNGIGQYLSNPVVIKIIGKNFPINKVIAHKKIIVENMGFVDNPYPIIGECRAMLCPLFTGAGIKVKVIESLASGTPVIGTDIAFEGFSERYKNFMHKAQDLESFSKEIEHIGYSIEERETFKKMFLNDYASLTIPKWLENKLCN